MKDFRIQNPVPIAPEQKKPKGDPSGASETSFQDFLKESVQEVEKMQQEARESVETLAVGKSENIHETMIALKKAEISFKMMMQIRNKIVKAYEEVMRMQV